MNKVTVADLLGPQKERYGRSVIEQEMGKVLEAGDRTEATLREMHLVVDPSDCEIVDGKVVITKRIIANSRDDALRKFGVQFR